MTDRPATDPEALLRARAAFERRKYRRAEIRLPIVVHRRDAAPLPGVTLDLSPFGMKALLHAECGEEEVVEAVIDLPTGPLRAPAIVVRCRPEGLGCRVSFAFHRLDLDQFNQLRDFVDLAKG